MVVVMLPIIGVAIAGIAYTWVLTYREVREAQVLEWPQTIAFLSVLAVTMQAPLPFVMALFFIDPPNPKIRWIAGFEVLFFLVSLPCALKRKGPARWWLALSSIFFLVFTGFIYIVSQMKFF
jgi:hypothetical protein